MRVVVDRTRCIGSGQCVMTDPEVFDQDEDEGLVVLRTPEPPESARERMRAAVALCPSAAIRLEE
ncbi:ferredoxin [Marinitenerispora sediminis]|uniref:Ferredoxin n=1 Tax=Marinitenerispora sediminis TaxID=1931232 RepID=A0A368SZ34_9ACTN|nr:ferredoxin [Marinitenerispora sediminis]RCV50188.1 ferredoxin [Marinitenerispora sediminis]RCV52265.1 ferredoxin [Marinitenerispora sediminis]RCV56894.1 ferredoxin [Marinitenerispora sediminis]